MEKSTLCFPVPVGAAPKPQMPEAAEALRGQNLVPWIPEKDVLTEFLQQNIEKNEIDQYRTRWWDMGFSWEWDDMG